MNYATRFLPVFSLSVAFAAPAFAGSPCDHPYAQTRKECDAVKEWVPEAFTDPEKLDQVDEFRVVFHSISASGWAGKGMPRGRNAYALAHPEVIESIPKIAASLISPAKRTTFMGYIGYVLEVHPENVVATSLHDLDSRNVGVPDFSEVSMGALAEASRQEAWDIYSPEAVLAHSGKDSHNEIILTAQAPGTIARVRVVGVLIRCDEPKIRRLNAMDSSEFRRYVRNECQAWPDEAIEMIDALRERYPTYGYALGIEL